MFQQQTRYETRQKRGVFDSVSDLSPLSEDVKNHLTDVYSLLAGTIAMAALGCYLSVQNIFSFNVTLSGIATLILSIMIYTTRPSQHIPYNQQYSRLAMLGGLGFLNGSSIGPLVEYVLDLNSSLVLYALVATCLIFGSFTYASMKPGNSRESLYVSAIISTGTSILLWTGLFHLFFRSELLFNISLYGGLIVFAFYVIYDTQMIIEKVRMFGSENCDPIHHSLELFIDFFQLFVRILIILAKKDEKKKRED